MSCLACSWPRGVCGVGRGRLTSRWRSRERDPHHERQDHSRRIGNHHARVDAVVAARRLGQRRGRAGGDHRGGAGGLHGRPRSSSTTGTARSPATMVVLALLLPAPVMAQDAAPEPALAVQTTLINFDTVIAQQGLRVCRRRRSTRSRSTRWPVSHGRVRGRRTEGRARRSRSAPDARLRARCRSLRTTLNGAVRYQWERDAPRHAAPNLRCARCRYRSARVRCAWGVQPGPRRGSGRRGEASSRSESGSDARTGG